MEDRKPFTDRTNTKISLDTQPFCWQKAKESVIGRTAFGRTALGRTALGLASMACIASHFAGCPEVAMGQTLSATSGVVTAAATARQEIDAPWIWSPRMNSDVAGAQGEVFFRKKFTLVSPESAELTIAAGDEFEVFLNGQMVASGQSFGAPTKLDPTPFLEAGVNLIAVRVRHLDGDHFGLAVKMRFKENGEVRHRVLRTDESWRSYTAKAFEWYKNGFNSRSWLSSRVVPASTVAAPAAASASSSTPTSKPAAPVKQVVAAKNSRPLKPLVESRVDHVDPPKPAVTLSTSLQATPAQKQAAQTGEALPAASRAKLEKAAAVKKQVSAFMVAGDDSVSGSIQAKADFAVTRVLAGADTGSLMAIEFNEYGQLLLSREGGHLLIAETSEGTSEVNAKGLAIYCNEVKSCSGILPLNGDVYVTADGPDGLGLYRLGDADGDGRIQVSETLLTFTGKSIENGPHGITLGPDGMIYVVVGSGSELKEKVADSSPFQFKYDGNLSPKSASSMQSGCVVRVAIDGSRVERVASGITNAQDLVFDQNGELFVHDSDSAADRGTSWYCPSGIYNVTAGSELGYRQGGGRFSPIYVDQSPMICATGAGSPTGAVLYQHLQFPARYQNAIFFADQDAGTISTFTRKHEGAGFAGSTEVFLQGETMKVRDMAIGEDGSLYFCTSGGSKESGVYKVAWQGTIPPEVVTFEDDLARVMRHPQPNSAWARQNTAELRRQMGRQWNESVLGVVTEKHNLAKFRVRAMQLSVLYGPKLPYQVLRSLTQDKDATVRAAAAQLCGVSDRREDHDLLENLLKDETTLVRQKACESIMRVGVEVTPQRLEAMLVSGDRTEAMTARRLLERIDAAKWQDAFIQSDNLPLYVQGAIALMGSQPSTERAYKVLAEGTKILDGHLTDAQFLDLLRVFELAIDQGNVPADKIPAFAARIGDEFPTGNAALNLELIEILAGLDIGQLDGRIADYLRSPEVSDREKFHAAVCFGDNASVLSQDVKLAMAQAIGHLKRVPEFRSETGRSSLAAVERSLPSSITPAAPAAIAEPKPMIAEAPVVKKKAVVAQFAAASVAVDESAFEKSTKSAFEQSNSSQSKIETRKENSIEAVVANGDSDPKAVIDAFYRMPHPLGNDLAESLKQLDQKLIGRKDNDAIQVRLGVIALLASNGSEDSFAYLRKLYDNEPERRSDIAIGLSVAPTGSNWRYLVSSLPVLDQVTAIDVMRKLTAVPHRPRSAVHYQDVVSIGKRLGKQSPEAADAADQLLRHWSGTTVTPNGQSPVDAMSQWEQWVAAQFRDRTATATLPTKVIEQAKEPLIRIDPAFGNEATRVAEKVQSGFDGLRNETDFRLPQTDASAFVR